MPPRTVAEATETREVVEERKAEETEAVAAGAAAWQEVSSEVAVPLVQEV